jgi:hypothetical protein
MAICRAGFHIAVFELSYLERDGWSGVAHFWLENGDGPQVERDFCRERFDRSDRHHPRHGNPRKQ